MKTVTVKIDNKYSGKDDPKSVKELFVMGYNISQIELITGKVYFKQSLEMLSLQDVINRIEKTDIQDVELLEQITGIKWEED